MRRKYITNWIAPAIVTFSALAAFGQTPGEPQENPEPLKVVDPQRKFEFEETDEPLEKRLIRADPKLLELKFVAEVRLQYVRHSGRATSRLSGLLGKFACFPTTVQQGRTRFNGNVSLMGSGAINEWKNHHDYFAALIANVPEEKRPPADLVAVFLEQADEGYVWHEMEISTESPEPIIVHTFYILADSKDHARRLADAFLTLFDYGVFLQAQTKVVAARHETEQQLKDAREIRDEEQKKFDILSKKLENAPSVDKDAVADFRIRQHLLEVDLAGTRARIETVNQLLAARGELKASRIDQLEELKITAEVELAGLAAQKKALSELIAMGENRARIRGELESARSKFASAMEQEKRLTSSISELNQVFEQLAPFPLVDDQVIVRPIKWTSEME